MITPTLDNVVIEPVEAEEKSANGILLPDSAKEKPQIGTVLNSGPKCETPLKKGNKVIYKKWMGTEIKLEGKTYILVSEKDILGIIK